MSGWSEDEPVADWLRGWCDHDLNHPDDCCAWTKAAAAVEALAVEAAEARLVAPDAEFMARCARGSSWPGEMAHSVESAADRVQRWVKGLRP